jgi:predicted ferric reductase
VKPVDYPVILTVCLFLAGTTILTWCFGIYPGSSVGLIVAVRSKSVESWRTLSYTRWRIFHFWKSLIVVVLLVYVDSYFFVISTSILQVGVGLTQNMAACEYSPS